MWVLASVVCTIGAIIIYPNDGWGWFLLAAILVAGAGTSHG